VSGFEIPPSRRDLFCCFSSLAISIAAQIEIYYSVLVIREAEFPEYLGRSKSWSEKREVKPTHQRRNYYEQAIASSTSLIVQMSSPVVFGYHCRRDRGREDWAVGSI